MKAHKIQFHILTIGGSKLVPTLIDPTDVIIKTTSAALCGTYEELSCRIQDNPANQKHTPTTVSCTVTVDILRSTWSQDMSVDTRELESLAKSEAR